MSTGAVKKCGYRRPGSTFFMCVFATSTKVLKYATIIHHLSCVPARIAHGSADILMLPLDYLLFDEEVASQDDNSYAWLEAWTRHVDL